MPSTSQSGVREDEGVARRFALVVSLTHAHNVSAASATNTASPPCQSGGEDDRADQQPPPAQLTINSLLPNGDHDGSLVVTAC